MIDTLYAMREDVATSRDAVREPIVHRFAGCVVHEWPDSGENGHLTTIFPDGARCEADRSSEMQHLDYARHLGYETVRDALREHELAHCFLAEKLGHPHSPTLRAVALGYAEGTAPYEERLFEEAVVLSFQRYVCTGEMGSPLERLLPELAFDVLNGWADEFSLDFVGAGGGMNGQFLPRQSSQVLKHDGATCEKSMAAVRAESPAAPEAG